MRVLRIGTRGSALARRQAEAVAAQLGHHTPGLTIELVIIRTTGDKLRDVPLSQVGGKGLFVKEIEEALRAGAVDLAVHSMKDVPTPLAAGLALVAIPPREDPRDVLVSRAPSLAALPAGAVVGTSSLRRRCQLLHLRPDLVVEDLRGNVDTRLSKLDAGRYDALLLAAAGLVRLGHATRITQALEVEQMIPAAGQGALGLESRGDDEWLRELARPLHHEPTACCLAAERALLERLGGGCQVPIAAHSSLSREGLHLVAMVGHPRGTPLFRAEGVGSADAAAALGMEVAEQLLAQGAGQLLKEVDAAG